MAGRPRGSENVATVYGQNENLKQCPGCACSRSRVVKTNRYTMSLGKINTVRRRQCKQCGAFWKTSELTNGDA